MLRRLVVLLLTVCCVPLCVYAASGQTLVFTGALNDTQAKPVAGLFVMRFALHNQLDDPRMMWSEEFVVAVEKGKYQVELGKERPLPGGLPLTSLFLSVAIDGQEAQRVPVAASMISSPTVAPAQNPDGSAGCKQCETAKKAADSDRVGGMTVQQITESAAQRQIRVGSPSYNSGAGGSTLGKEFTLACPPGFVATGIKGTAGETSVNSIQLMCSPLEAK